jgi:hypothetical protein
MPPTYVHLQAPEPPPAGDDGVGVTANKPWKPRPKRGAEAAEPPYSGSRRFRERAGHNLSER